MKSITDVLQIQYPIIQGGMAWVSEAYLAAAVSNAGGAGIIAAGGRTEAFVREQIKLAKTLTDKPFGVNIQLMAENKEQVIEVICEEKPAFVTLGAGNPVPYIEKLKDVGIKVIPVVPNVKLAKRIEAAGADAIVVEGMEAGGHIGTITTLPLLTQVIPEVNIPVVIAGGFADGRGLAAALLMGAAGVQMGTRFLVAEECKVHDNVKTKLLEAVDTDSIVTGNLKGHGVRGLKNKYTLNFVETERKGATDEELTQLARGANKLAAIDGDVENGMILAGQTLLPLKKIEPAKMIIENIIQEARETLAKANQIIL